MTWGIFLPYWTGWLIHTKGITVSQASLIMSLGLVARGLSTLIAFPYFSEKFSSKILLNAMAIGTIISLLSYIPATSFPGLLLATLLLHLFYPALMPALDSAAGTLVQNKQLVDYGKSRSFGSIGFVVAGMTLTLFTGALGDEVILWALLFGTLIYLFLGFMYSPVILSKKPKMDQNKHGMMRLFRIKHFGLVLVIVILLQAARLLL